VVVCGNVGGSFLFLIWIKFFAFKLKCIMSSIWFKMCDLEQLVFTEFDLIMVFGGEIMEMSLSIPEGILVGMCWPL